MSGKKYCLTISFVQSTDGIPDDDVVVREFSDDLLIHAIKTQVFTKYLTEMVNAVTKELTDMAIAGGNVKQPVQDKFER